MLMTANRRRLNRIVILNPKGGCGKTTLATNLASYYAQRKTQPAVMDYDPQGSCTTWIEQREKSMPPVYGIEAYKQLMHATRSWQLRVPVETKNVIIDTPAGIAKGDLQQLTQDASSVLVPVMPSSIDIRAASRCIADLLLVAKIDRRDRKLAVVANRTRQNTKSLDTLMRFLDSLDIPIIAVLRDSQNFVHAAEAGLGICELPPHKTRKDMEQFEKVTTWLDHWQERRVTPSYPDNVAIPPKALELQRPAL